jgi:hypothetical protein
VCLLGLSFILMIMVRPWCIFWRNSIWKGIKFTMSHNTKGLPNTAVKKCSFIDVHTIFPIYLYFFSVHLPTLSPTNAEALLFALHQEPYVLLNTCMHAQANKAYIHGDFPSCFTCSWKLFYSECELVLILRIIVEQKFRWETAERMSRTWAMKGNLESR